MSVKNPSDNEAKARQEARKSSTESGSSVGPVTSAIVSAAGLGARLGTLTRECPKALVAVNGEPLLPRLAKQLSQAGVKNLTVVLGYRGDQIRDALGTNAGGMQVSYVHAANYASTNNIASLAVAPCPTAPVAISDCDVFLSRLPHDWLRETGSDIVIPTRALARDEAGTVLRMQNGRWRLKVLRQPSEARAGDRKTISLYLLFSSDLIKIFFREIGRTVANRETSLYYEDVLSGVLRDTYTIADVAIEDQGIAAFEIDRPIDLQAAEQWAANA
ncbi:NTP transferase domain-containing protein [Nitratireductor thuwali]|uniref:Bifunctional IPC transferase and DIPP synthase n=1 Tax=Nitratireductor thuwali TaxID=2267699 RepID=A0ABY5MNX6_9HYPH|nr:Bifunctional IPC transferase and DIPP synthase [Nitratireductor thuwali]